MGNIQDSLRDNLRTWLFPQETMHTVIKQQTQAIEQSAQEHEQKQLAVLVKTTGIANWIKESIFKLVLSCGSIFMAALLGYGQGYLFSGFHEFGSDTWLPYIGGYMWEAVALACYFRAHSFFLDGKKNWFAATLACGLVLISVSVVAQLTMLEHQFVAGEINDQAIESLPVFSIIFALVPNLTGHDFLFILRGLGFHIIEIACVFIIPAEKEDIKATVQRDMDRAWGQAQLQISTIMTDNLKNIADVMTIGMKQVAEQMRLNGQELLDKRQKKIVDEKPTIIETLQNPLERVVVDEKPLVREEQTQTASQNTEAFSSIIEPFREDVETIPQKQKATAFSSTTPYQFLLPEFDLQDPVDRWGWKDKKHKGYPSCDEEERDARKHYDETGKLPGCFLSMRSLRKRG